MREVITNLIDVPFARMFVLAGIIFLMIAVLGKVEGKIDPGNVGRMGASILGTILLFIGVAMQYMEVREFASEKAALQSRMQQSAEKQPVTPDASAKQAGAQDTVSAERPAIKVASATYGRNCNAKAGNATQLIAKACDEKTVCDYTVEPVELEDAQANCAKDFAAEWKCGSGSAVYTAVLPAGAGKDEKLHLTCAS